MTPHTDPRARITPADALPPKWEGMTLNNLKPFRITTPASKPCTRLVDEEVAKQHKPTLTYKVPELHTPREVAMMIRQLPL